MHAGEGLRLEAKAEDHSVPHASQNTQRIIAKRRGRTVAQPLLVQVAAPAQWIMQDRTPVTFDGESEGVDREVTPPQIGLDTRATVGSEIIA